MVSDFPYPRYGGPSGGSVHEIFVFEEDQIENGYGDVAVGDVEDRTEENEVAAADPRHPVGPGRFDDREVEHVHHLAVQERGVAASLGEERGDGMRSRFGKDQSVEGAVDHVADGAGQNQRKADDHALGGRAVDQPVGVPGDQDDGGNADQAEEEFAPFAAELHAEGCARVLDEVDLEPVTEDGNALVERHVEFDDELDDLVDEQEQDDEDRHFFIGREVADHVCSCKIWCCV